MKNQEKETAQRKERAPWAEMIYKARFDRHLDELRWLYMELYDNGAMFAELCDNLRLFYEERGKELKKLDAQREKVPDWYKKNDMLGMMLYIDNFAGNLHGVQNKLDYIKSCNVNSITNS